MLKKDFNVNEMVLPSNLVTATKEDLTQLNKLATFPDPLQVGDEFVVLGMKVDVKNPTTGLLNPQIFGLVNKSIDEEFDKADVKTLSFRAITRKGQGQDGKKPQDILIPEKIQEKYKDKTLTPVFPLSQGVSVQTFLDRIDGKTLVYAASEEVEAVYNNQPATVVLQNWCIVE